MFGNVLVGVDHHIGGRDAVELAKRLVAPGGELTLAHIVLGDARLRQWSEAEYAAARSEGAGELLTRTRDDAGIQADLRCEESSSVGRGLHVLAEAAGADLLVVGSSRRGLLGRVLLGDDACAALNGAPCAVAVAPAGYSQHPGAIHEVGVGYNGSRESEHAVKVATEIAAEHGAKLSALEAVSLPALGFAGGPGPLDGAIESVLERARQRIARLGGIQPRPAYGTPAEELAIYSGSLDLLVVGSRDYGPIGRLVHGSTSRQLTRTARCPLLVLTRAARSAQTPEPGSTAGGVAEKHAV